MFRNQPGVVKTGMNLETLLLNCLENLTWEMIVSHVTDRPLILGIETSGRSGTIALLQDQKVIADFELSATGRRHARTLIPEIGNALSRHSLAPQDLDLVAVSIGPGSFTGLRVGIVCAKTMSYALQIPLVAVDTFEAIAHSADENVTEQWIIDDALRGDVFVGHYQRNDSGHWSAVSRPSLISLEIFAAQLPSGGRVTGPGVTKLRDDLEEAGIRDAAQVVPQAIHVAKLAQQRFNSGQTDDYWTVEPHYIRRSAAEEKADQTES